jgi:hypothetical protein
MFLGHRWDPLSVIVGGLFIVALGFVELMLFLFMAWVRDRHERRRSIQQLFHDMRETTKR